MYEEFLEKTFRRKSLFAYKTALLIVDSDPNGAANRAYYSLFQAIVAELERLKVRPEQIDAGAARAFKDDEQLKWTHSFVSRNASIAGLSGRQCTLLRLARRMRTVADYESDEIEVGEVKSVLRQIPDILECLGINVGS